jgi:hypothetical protein
MKSAEKNNTIFYLFYLFFIVLIVEIFLRSYSYYFPVLQIEMWKYASFIKMQSQNSNIGHVHIPNQNIKLMGSDIRINSKGFRGPEITNHKDKIVTIGDSLTFGWGVEEQKTFSSLLQLKINSDLPNKFEVINMGVGNYNLSMSLNSLIENYNDLKPKMVILFLFINDAEPTPSYRTNFLSENSAFFTLLFSIYDTLRRLIFDDLNWKNYYLNLYTSDNQNFFNAFTKFGAFCKTMNIKCIVVNYPELRELKPYPFSHITDLVKNISNINNLYFYDLLPALENYSPPSLWVNSSDPHPNGFANEISMENFYNNYLKNILK